MAKALRWLTVKTWRLCAVLVLVAAAIQLVFIFESQRSLVFQVPIVDAAGYHAQAMGLAKGEGDSHRAFWQPPLYPYLLAGLYRTGMTELLPVRCAQVPIGLAAVLLAYAIGRRCGGPWTGFAAGLGVCLYGPLLFYFSQLLPSGLAVTLNLGAVLLWLRLAEKPVWPRALALGVVAGLATLTVANSAVIVLLVLGWMAWTLAATRGRHGDRPRPETPKARNQALVAAALVGGFAVTILPVTIRNYVVSHEFVPVATNGGINLFIGNNPHPEQTLTVRPGMDWGRLVALPYRQGAKTDTEADRYFLREVRDFVKASPLLFLKGLARKAFEASGSREIPRNEDLYAFAGQSGVLRVLAWRIGSFAFPFGVVGPLAILGAVTMTRRHTARNLVLVFAAGYLASVILFFPSSRYLAPVMPALILFAVLGGQHLAGWKSLSVASRSVSVGVLVVAGVWVNLPRHLPTDRVDYAAELHAYVGAGLQARGRTQEAMAEYRRAIGLNPNHADAHRFLGMAYRASGKTDLAVEEFERVLALRPDHDGAMQDLAVIRYKQGRLTEAVDLLHTVLELNPDDRQAMVNLGVGLMRLKRKAEAAEWFRKAGVAGPAEPAK
jgi:lipoprotein NlpI